MYRLAIQTALLAAVTAAAGFAQAPNTLSSAESSQGWMLLFDGKDLKGWTSRPTTEPTKSGDWKAANGAMACGGTQPSWIATDATFTNFELKAELRPATDQTNSGIFIRSQKEGEPATTGYEVQVWDHQPQGFLTGSLVNHIKAKPVTLKPNQWNTYDISANGDHFVIKVNGTTVVDDHNSAHSAGVIGLQCQMDNKIEYRNVKLRPLK